VIVRDGWKGGVFPGVVVCEVREASLASAEVALQSIN
jgi:hypothetical protein